VIEWFGGSLVSRLIDKRTGAIVAVMQPLRQGDLHGPGSFAEFLIQALQAQGVRSRRRIQHWFQRDAETWGAGASSIFLMWKTWTLEKSFHRRDVAPDPCPAGADYDENAGAMAAGEAVARR
jgi:hypothetical protein